MAGAASSARENATGWATGIEGIQEPLELTNWKFNTPGPQTVPRSLIIPKTPFFRGTWLSPGVFIEHESPGSLSEYRGFHIKSGNDLLSHTFARVVPSARKGLTAEFGMGSGVTPSLWSPEFQNQSGRDQHHVLYLPIPLLMHPKLHGINKKYWLSRTTY
jgi:hypothetical protein